MRRRAMTLVELVIAAALLGLIGTLSVQFITRLFHLTARSGQRGKLQSEAMVTLKNLQADLQRTESFRIVQTPVGTDGLVVGFPVIEEVSGQGRRAWDESYVVYRLEEKKLVRRRCSGSDAARPAPLTAAQLLAFAPNNTDRRLSDCLTRLYVDVEPGPCVNVTLSLAVERETLRLSSVVGLRN